MQAPCEKPTRAMLGSARPAARACATAASMASSDQPRHGSLSSIGS